MERGFWLCVLAAVVVLAGCSAVGEGSATLAAAFDEATATTDSVGRQVLDGELSRIDPIEGEAPVRLAGHHPGVVSNVAYPETIPWDEPEPPSGFGIEIESCWRPAPGVVAVGGMVEDDGSVAFPVTIGVYAVVTSGEVGTPVGADVTFDGPGPFSLVLSAVGQRAAMAAAGRTDFEFVDRGVATRIPRNWNSGECSLEARPLRTNEVPLAIDPAELEASAPNGTIEALAQSISPRGEESSLYPLLVAYGEAIHFMSERWFLPEQPVDHLLSINENLDADRCLELELTFETYTVTQRRNCQAQSNGGIQPTPMRAAFATDGEWVVEVRADSREKAQEIMSSLQPYWHLTHNEMAS